MSLVEKALRKLQTTRGDIKTRSSAVEATRPETSVLAPALESVEELTFDPSRHSSRIARLDLDRLRSLKVLPPAEDRKVDSQFRALKRPLIRYAQEATDNDVLKRAVMVASALPGDGKTFTTLNLALSLALELDMRVLLVDADTPKRHLTRTLELDAEPGLLDVVAGLKPRVEDLILPTDVPRLDLLPVGTRSDTATELVASGKMLETVTHLVRLYRRGIVLFDSPPILLTNEARSLATIMGQIVLVVRAGVTPQRATQQAVELLGEGRRISVVLNSVELDGAAGYYYGHRYGYGYGEEGAATGGKSAS